MSWGARDTVPSESNGKGYVQVLAMAIMTIMLMRQVLEAVSTCAFPKALSLHLPFHCSAALET